MYNYELEVIEKKKLSPTAACLRLGLNGKEFKFSPGQYVQAELKLEERDGFKLNGMPDIQKRSFSISSSPNEKRYIELTCKAVPNGFTSVYVVNCMQPHDKLKITGPMGNLAFDEKNSKKNLVFLAAGSGISPIMSIIRYISENKIKVNALLIYSNKIEDEILWKKEIEVISKKNKNIKHIFTLTQQEWKGQKGRISKEMIESKVKEIRDIDFFIVGPPPFVAEMEKILQELGVKENSIKKEMY